MKLLFVSLFCGLQPVSYSPIMDATWQSCFLAFLAGDKVQKQENSIFIFA